MINKKMTTVEAKNSRESAARGVRKKPLPLLLLPSVVLFPENVIPLTSFSGLRSKELQAVKSGKVYFGVLTRLKQGDKAETEVVSGYGTEAVVTALIKLPNGEIGAMVKGLRRFKVASVKRKKFGYVGQVRFIKDKPFKVAGEFLGELRAFKDLVVKFLKHQPNLNQEALSQIFASDDPQLLGFLIAPHLSLPLIEKIAILGCTDFRKRVGLLIEALGKEIELLRISSRIQDQVKDGVHDSLRRNFLREQMQMIKKELGDLGGGEADELATLKKKLADLSLPAQISEAAQKESERLGLMHPGSPEYMVAWNYLNWIVDLPWRDFSSEEWKKAPQFSLDLKEAATLLDKQHFGLHKIKERIMEFIAVLRHRGRASGQILLFVGPPGVGKTSLGKSIAEALDRPFVRVSLGGVKDEAEIRGHRRTYIGAMPGKIIQALKEAKSPRPVVLLDEIDKVGKDGFRDLSAALLEVLDPEQNTHFTDHYLGLPFDLSQVLFLATANSLRELSAPLLDRMEVLELSGYTENEKVHIARDYLLPNVCKNLALEDGQLASIDASVLKPIIRYYTREAGVRQLNRSLNTIGRKIVRKIVEETWSAQASVQEKDLLRYLGTPRYFPEPLDSKLSPGVAIGLAYTSVGGDILYIESRKNKGKNGSANLVLTGSLGKVMQESAQAVLSFLLSHSEMLALDREEMEQSHVHIHLPDGATPKDGPSAGAALLCAVTSLFLGKALPIEMAMTGEITLRGQVLPVGGIKEKLIAAHRYGKKSIIIPAANWLDLEDIPEEVLHELRIFPVREMLEVLLIAGLVQKPQGMAMPLAQAFKKGLLERDFPFGRGGSEGPWLYQ